MPSAVIIPLTVKITEYETKVLLCRPLLACSGHVADAVSSVDEWQL